MHTGIGDTLRAARRAQGHTLTDAAEATRVRETYLAALEEEDFDALGGEVYARGFLRSYARFLSLDPEPLVEAFGRRALAQAQPRGRARPIRQPHVPAGTLAAPPERPAGAAVLLVLLVVVLVVIAFVGLSDDPAGALAATSPLSGGRP